MEGNLAKLNKLVRKGKADADVLEDRLRKVRVCCHGTAAAGRQTSGSVAMRIILVSMLQVTQR